ncbi:MAG: glycosyltransferase family 2 protein [Pseudomonadota bacterium]
MSASLRVVGGQRVSDARQGVSPLGQILLENEWVDEDDLFAALSIQGRTGVRLGDLLVAHGWADRDAVAAALAQQTGLGFADLVHDPPDPTAARPEDLDTYLTHRIIPWRKVGKITAYACAEPERAAEALGALESGHGMAFIVVANPARIDAALLEQFGPDLAERAARLTPEDQSVRSLDTMRYGAGVVAALALVAAFIAPSALLLGAAATLLILNLATTVTRVLALVAGWRDERTAGQLIATQDAPVVLADRRPLPRLSVLIPLYREAEMIPRIVEALDATDYPRELLDVKLLLEADDGATREAAVSAGLPGWITALVMPDGAPRTKPRAMNLALDFCEGEVIGILDAEDRPAADQFREVARFLATAPAETACVQCQLSYFNVRENWVTRCFQIEYSIWFDVLLRGFQRLGLPIPLGGTSVYFRRRALEEARGWDAHNVTEDADLGMRLARAGLKTAVLRSVTEEEANCRIMPWIRQRSRWLKGYVLTWMSHMRAPGRLWCELGPVGFLGLNVLFVGGAVTYLAMPVFWIALGLTLFAGTSLFGAVLPGWAATVLGVSLALGQVVMLACAVVALKRRRMLDLLIVVPSLPVYWTMGAAAAWKAVIEVVAAPYYWDKTRHGISRCFGADAAVSADDRRSADDNEDSVT